MAKSIGISEAVLLTLFLASVFWGMLLITSAYCFRYLLWESDERGSRLKSVSNIRWLMLTTTLVLLAMCTFNIAMGLAHSMEAFIFYTGPGGSAAELTQGGLSGWMNLATTCNITFSKLISDAILIYRCWIVLSHNVTVVTFPILLWLGELAMVIFLIFREVHTRGSGVVFTSTGVKAPQAAIIAAWSMSLTINIITTGLIVYRIWRVDRENSLYTVQAQTTFGSVIHRKTRLQRVTRIIIESGLMYTTVAFITFITFVAGNNMFYPLGNVELQILAIAFNLIIIRISTQPSGSEAYNVRSGMTLPLQQGPPLFLVHSKSNHSLTHPV